MESTSTTDRAEQLLNAYGEFGWKTVKVNRELKKPVYDGWQLKTIPYEEMREHVINGGNVGIQAGEVSDWICAGDLDSEEAVRLAPKFLPETLKSGKQGIPTHWIYRSPGAGYRQFRDVNREMLIELKASENGAGHQFVVEPSIHPEKGPYQWIPAFNPALIAELPKEELEKRLRHLAVAVLIVRNFPPDGGHDYANSLCGFLLRNGMTYEDLKHILEACWPADKIQRHNVAGAIDGTAAKLTRNEPVTGGRTLEELVPGLPKALARALGWERVDTREVRRHYERSDLGNAERFVDMHGGRVRWCPARKMFLFYDGRRWVWDECGEAVKLAQETARSIHKDAASEPDPAKQRDIAKFAISSQNEGRINGMLSQAKPHLAVRLEDLDKDPWAINCQNGTLDLRTGRLKAHDPADLITKAAPVEYKPEADCPRFYFFLKEVLVEDAVVAFVKRYSGYSATGITRERLFAILYGFGKNGKTTLIELLQDVLGDYATNADTETILAKRHQGVGNDVAALKGARFVSAAEVEKGRRLAESKVKQLTGSDTVTARFLFGEPFNFRPEFKLWLSTNNKPVIQGTDDAIWDRIRLIPFTQRFEGSKADPKLPEKLREELPGVFAWIVEGCLEWQEHGLGEPESVAAATEQYRAEMDTLAAFLEDRCVVQKDLVAPATPLYKEYRFWCEGAGEKPETQKMFGMRLRERGFINAKITSGAEKDRKGWFGIGLRADHPDPEDPDKVPDNESSGSPGGSKGPLSGPTADDGPLGQSSGFAGKKHARVFVADDSGPKNHNLRAEIPRVGKVMEKRSASSAPSANGHVCPAQRLLEDPPDWLEKQLSKYQDEPERFLKPTCAAMAEEAYNTVTRWKEVEPFLKRWLEEVSK
jgi:putative DNA primase/helicase